MTIWANVAFCKNQFVAILSDGRQIERSEFRDLAHALHCVGVRADAVQYDWRAGHRMMTAGQQVALQAEMRRLELAPTKLSIAA